MEEEKLKKLQEEHRQILKEKREVLKKRKARTRRLIIHGAIAESFIKDSADMGADAFQQACVQALSGRQPGERKEEDS